ncbi:MAG TPA: hypothetical protein PKL44_01195 [Candidatus Dojkabacteria bacterium]|nr:hypothetical protein [Candidatus Dojkabacteria bacterium]
MNGDIEKIPTRKLERALERRDIRAVIFDLDNTVFLTDDYYITKKQNAYLEIAQLFPIKGLSPEEIMKQMSDAVHKKFVERNCKPLPVIEEYEQGLKEFYQENFHPQMSEILNKHFFGFYNNSPKIIPEAIPLFHFLYNYPQISFFAANTLADQDWTQVKIEQMKKMCGIDEIPFYTTDIENLKDWGKPVSDALSMGLSFQNILVIGDSLDSDILPARSLGVKNLIWIDRRNQYNTLEQSSIKQDLHVVKSLNEVWEIE